MTLEALPIFPWFLVFHKLISIKHMEFHKTEPYAMLTFLSTALKTGVCPVLPQIFLSLPHFLFNDVIFLCFLSPPAPLFSENL